MTGYVFRRVLLFIPTAIGVSVVIFFLLHIIPGDYATAVVLGGEDRANQATEEEIQRVREKLGLDRNVFVQYRDWAVNFLTGDLGQSLTNRQSVAERMLPRIAVSAQLAVMAVVIAVVVAIPFGVIAAVRQDTLIDYGLRFFSMIFESMPNFWLGLLLLVALAVLFDWKPPISYKDLWEEPWTNLQVMFFPALVVGARGSAGMLRMTRSSVLEVLREDYVRTAHAKGLQQAKILFVHVLRNALLPVTTLAGFEVVILFGGQVVIEQVFQIPGIGQLLVQAVAGRDTPVIQSIIMFIAMVVLLANLVVDLMYGLLDPRIRYS